MSTKASLAPLASQPFRWLLAARTTAILGNFVAPVAIAFAVLDLTGSPAALGLVLAARSLPQVVFMLAGGVVADRFPRRTVIIVAATVSALTQAAAAAAVLSGTATVGMLVAIEAVNGAASAFIFPAAAALTPLTVPSSMLQPANALIRMGMSGGMILGSALGGMLVAAVGPGVGLAVDAATFALAALLLVPLRVNSTPRGETRSARHDLREGWSEFSRRTWVWTVVLAFALLNAGVAATMGILGPVIADDSIGRASWGLVLAAQSLGLVLGGLVSLRLPMHHPLRVGLLAMLLGAPFFVVLALAPALVPLALLALAAGIGIEVFSVGWDVSLQEHIPIDRLARVYSYDMLGSFAMIPLGQIVVGPAAAAFGAPQTVLSVVALITVCLLVVLAVPSVRNLGRADVHSARRETDVVAL